MTLQIRQATSADAMLLNERYLNPAATSKGYGQLLFATIKALARDNEAGCLWLEVLEQNERACHFYNKQGMKHIKNTLFTTASQQSVLRIMGIAV